MPPPLEMDARHCRRRLPRSPARTAPPTKLEYRCLRAPIRGNEGRAADHFVRARYRPWNGGRGKLLPLPPEPCSLASLSLLLMTKTTALTLSSQRANTLRRCRFHLRSSKAHHHPSHMAHGPTNPTAHPTRRSVPLLARTHLPGGHLLSSRTTDRLPPLPPLLSSSPTPSLCCRTRRRHRGGQGRPPPRARLCPKPATRRRSARRSSTSPPAARSPARRPRRSRSPKNRPGFSPPARESEQKRRGSLRRTYG